MFLRLLLFFSLHLPTTVLATATGTYDYVVVGGGTAGLAIASLLSEKASVAVFEAGGFYEDIFPLIQIPGMDGSGVSLDPGATIPIDWGFVTEPIPQYKNRRVHYARGKCLGGSSARNFMLYQRPTKGSCQQWANEVGDDAYMFENWLPFFKKSVDWTPPAMHPVTENATTLYNEEAFLPQGGPVNLSYPEQTGPLFTWLAEINAANGIPPTDDFSSGELYGYKYVENMIDLSSHFRVSSETSYLRAVGGKVDVYPYSHVEKIVFSNEKEAIGIQVNGSTVCAQKEVILSAGAIQSPQILMLSGVGPKAELEAHSISLIHDLPGVGQNLQDQPTFGLSTEVQLATAVTNASSAAALAMWNANHSGPLTSSNVDAVGFGRFSDAVRASLQPETLEAIDNSYSADWPDFEQYGTAAFAGNQSGFAAPPDPTKNYASLVYIMMKNLSRGNITLASSDPFDAPKIFPNWLDHPADRDLAVAIFKVARSVLYSDAFKPLLADPSIPEVFPGPSVASDEEILDFIEENASHVWHACGTCKMGKADDEMAVVDSQARVRGVSRLRVVDASAFPFLPPGHPTAVVYALAEKIAADILGP